jgi:glycerol uptake facilitator-like aquaporin
MALEVKTTHFWRGTFGEFLGTMIFVFVSCGATLPLGGTIPVGDQAWAFGLAMTSVVQCVGYSTGGHINPAVTGAFVFTGKITWLRALVYVIAQITGGRKITNTHAKTHKLLITGLQTSCYKSAHKLPTSCVRTACSQLL